MEAKNPKWVEYLKKSNFLLGDNNLLNTPKEIFFPGTVQYQVSTIVNLNLLNSVVFEYCKNRLQLFKWLNDLGVKEPSNLEVLRKSIFELIQGDKVNLSNALQIGRFVFSVYKGGQLTDLDYQQISNIKLLTQNGLKKPNEIYLPDQYLPELKIENLLSTANFVTTSYPELKSDFPEWKAFFIKIGVKNKISVTLDPTIIPRATFIARYPYSNSYFKWLDTEEHYSKIYRPYKHQHSISNFVFITFYQYLDVHSFSKVFWKLIMDNWNGVYEKCSQTKYHYRGGSTLVPSFFQYYISKNASIPATDGKCYMSSEVYDPKPEKSNRKLLSSS